ncbi:MULTISPECIES: lambda exonuclease family protein [unclassified Bradyrhizobium]|uniref:lambda exonuclease family protein n=1 Tax=unclassified Bradyrhizobium TaxID=2631580 RepID=UPI0028E68AFD|nr:MULTISPECIES: YqaJ viral recombinase family protein [unclassified Bradyrhizobium]
MTIHKVEQGSPEWHALRCGKVTASKIPDVCARVKSGGYSAMRNNYKAALVLERLTGRPSEGGFTSKDIENGKLREPDARAEYELRFRCEVEQIGFADHPTIPMAGASADGLVGEDGGVEIKCPIAATHLAYLRADVVPSDYLPQITWNLACLPERKWWDFVSYHPDFPESMQLFRKRLMRDDKRIAETEAMVRDFLAEVDADVIALRRQFERRTGQPADIASAPLLRGLQDSAKLVGLA